MDQHRRHTPLVRTQSPPPPPPPPSSDTSFPILAISILGILTTAILLVSYYVFVIKCCLNWRRSDVITRLVRSRSRRRNYHNHRWQHDDLFTVYAATTTENRGLEESLIRAIPIIRFNKCDGGRLGGGEGSRIHECAVCLNEFEDGERLRQLPSCAHAFHIDCIDTWLQSNANCPLCRSEITGGPIERFVGQSVVIDVGEEVGGIGGGSEDTAEQQQHSPPAPPATAHRHPSPRKAAVAERRKGLQRKLHHLASMGDECIDVRGGNVDEQFSVQPIRRSFSMDSSCDRQLYLAVQDILQQNPHFYSQEISGGATAGEGCSSGGGRIRRSFFSFGRSSRSAVLPMPVEP